MRPKTVTVSSQTSSNVIPLDWRATPFSVGLMCTVPSGTLTYKVEMTSDDIYASGFSAGSAAWQDHAVITGKTASSNGNIAYPVRAIRLTVTAYTSGSVSMTVIQSPTT